MCLWLRQEGKQGWMGGPCQLYPGVGTGCSAKGNGSRNLASSRPCRLWRQRARRPIRRKSKNREWTKALALGGWGSQIWGTWSMRGVGMTPSFWQAMVKM